MKQILADTGPLVALLDIRDADHVDCLAAARQLKGILLTTWPVVTEALYLLAPDPGAQDALLAKLESRDVLLATLDASDVVAIRKLLARYRDLPWILPTRPWSIWATASGSTRCSRWTTTSGCTG